jgi:flagellar hook-basal body complex protein FliE
MTHHAIAAVQAVSGAHGATPATVPSAPAKASPESFSKMLLGGVDQVSQTVNRSDALAQAFVLNDNAVAPHQVAYALEQARLSVELMMQVRTQLVSGYQEIMRMQL